MDTIYLDRDRRYAVAQYPGVAFWYDAPQTRPQVVEAVYVGDYLDYEVEDVPTGLVLMVMVGDDRRHAVDPADVTPLNDDDYCPECGQVGCTGGRLS